MFVACRHDASKNMVSPCSLMSPTERFKLRRQLAAAAGKKSTTSLSLVMEVFGLEVEDETSTIATSFGQKEYGQGNGVTSRKKLE